MNIVLVQGNIARDPIIRSTKTGKAVARFTVAANEEYITPQGEKRELTNWVNVIAWGAWAELVGNTCQKGTQVFVKGRYTTSSYDDQNGKRVWTTEVTADFISPSVRGGQPSNQGFGQFGVMQPAPQQPAVPRHQQGTPFPAGPQEEIPF